MNHFRPPSLSLRFIPVWRRNFLVWRKLAIPSLLGNLADPMIYMLGLGYGLGSLLPDVGGVSYIAFLAAGAVCFSTMNAATFEALYSAFSRMQVQKTWDAILNAPVALDDLVLAELVWAASKATLSGAAILAVVAALGLVASPLALWALPVIFLAGLAFAALGLIMTALAPSYDFFMYYFTLAVTPMTLISGVFFPVGQLPAAFQAISAALPLSHAVQLARPLFLGEVPAQALLHVAVLAAYAVAAFWLALGLARRRLLK
ncbi:MAG: ABC transporter permease [Rhodocyclaceae bacterium]|jgi:lipooligosaccharide transport system permease protein|nr:Inner membrane transport permease YadH [Rhodocyclaceae bacterium]MBZ0143542.1 ABC transporter permease [Rhodocyclaceae bacterium]MCC7270761.1 ABC transporter permease [Rhodocyclaceae bacterium]MCL4682236.1 ABC transporter permease [Rhodocyclaceae bacterium]